MNLNLKLHTKQIVAYMSAATEILYGGAAGGGKSHLMRFVAIMFCSAIPNFQCYLFRRVSNDLFKNHMTGPGSFMIMMAPWFEASLVWHNASKNYIEFWNGSRIWLCHCQHEKDMYKYQGAEIHLLLIDELTHFSETIYKYLRGRCRLGGLELPEQFRGMFPRIICGSNPGGVGHTWVKRMFVNLCSPLKLYKMHKKQGGMIRQYIPAKMDDNPTLMVNDPDYMDRLEGLGSPELVKAMKDGDWDIVAGGALDDIWDPSVLRIPRFSIPDNWRLNRSLDWGSAAPFSVGWWARANGEEVYIPDVGMWCPQRGSLIRIHEWYGTKEIGSNVGLKMSAVEVAEGIIKREKYLKSERWINGKISPGPADSSIYATQEKKSDSIGYKMAKAGVEWCKADKSPGSRVNGLQLLRDRITASLRGEGEGIYFMDHCLSVFETLPVLPRDEHNPEDVDSDAEDHPYDEIRYQCLDDGELPAENINVKYAT